MINLNQHSPGYEQGAPIPGQGDGGRKIEAVRNDSYVSPSEQDGKPVRVKVISMNIPETLKGMRQWVLWRHELDEKGKWKKVPYHAKYTTLRARPNDSTTWSPYETVLEGYLNTSNIDGIGFVPSINDFITAIDMDDCIDEAGNIAPWAQEIITLIDSYTEISPSGKGIRIFFLGKLPGTGRKKAGLEVYDKVHYLTVTGHHIPSTPSDIQSRQQQLDTFMDKYFKEDPGPNTNYEPGESVLTDDVVIEKASAATNGDKFKTLWAGDTSGYPSPSEADSALCFILAFWTRKDPAQMDRLFRASGLYRDKWDEKHGAKTYGQMTIERAIVKCQEVYTQSAQPTGGEVADIDVEVPSWPTLDKKALYGLAGQVVKLATRSSEADPAAVLATLLVWFAAEVGPSPFMMVGDSKHFARLATVIVGGSSKARKGTSAKPIERLFSINSTDYRRARTSPGPLSSGEGLVYAVRDAVREWVVVDKKTQQYDWVVTDPGEDDKRLVVIDEEFGAGLSCTKREGNTLSTIIRQSWDHGTIEPLTKTKRIKATGAHINIVTHITIAELKQKLHETEALNGFGNRFMWVCARRNGIVSRPMPMPETEVEILRSKIIAAAQAAKLDGALMDFSDGTWREWKRVYPELSKDHPGLAGVIVNRAEAQVVRLSMIYALLDQTFIIEPVHLEAALAFWKYCEDSALFIFGGREQDAIADKIIEALREKDLSSTEISDLFARNISSERIKVALRDLYTSGRVTSHKVTKETGRPKVMYTLVKHEEKNNPNEKNEISTPSSGVNSFNSSNEVEI